MSKRPSDGQNHSPTSNEEKLESFRKFKVAHRNIVAVSNQVKSASQYLEPGCFICLVGPPGIGKTTVMEGVYGSVLRSYMPRMITDPGFIPAIKVNTKAEDGRFDWKEHWKDCLRAILEPLVDYKVRAGRGIGGDKGYEDVNPDGGGAKTLFRNAFEGAAKNRGLVICFKDEAHHFTFVSSARLIRRQHEILKSAAIRSEAIFALFGTYDLLELLNLSGQLGRRTRIFHFERYRPNIQEDVEAFVDALKTLLTNMPLRKPPIFSNDDLATCLDMSLGSVGLMKDILVTTLYSVLESNQTSLSIKDVIEHELSTDILDRVSREIVRGEKKLKMSTATRELKRQTIKLRMEKGAEYEEGNFKEEMPSDDVEEPPTKESEHKQPPRKKRPKKGGRIERSPKRDPVGAGRRNG
jgi:energy-coupling factor transporter ATP-binding protein EcfA2